MRHGGPCPAKSAPGHKFYFRSALVPQNSLPSFLNRGPLAFFYGHAMIWGHPRSMNMDIVLVMAMTWRSPANHENVVREP
jgi:hypothetical protein